MRLDVVNVNIKAHVSSAQVNDGLEPQEDAPTEDDIEQLEDKLENARSEQKNLFLIIFQVR